MAYTDDVDDDDDDDDDGNDGDVDDGDDDDDDGGGGGGGGGDDYGDDDTGAPRRAFQLPVACTRRRWLPLYGPCVISEHVEIRFLVTTPALTYSYRRVRGLF